jgi:hypothetical protein
MAAVALDIHARSLVLDGRPFGRGGPYEKISGYLRFAVDPEHPQNAGLVDLALAPRNAAGRVEFGGDFYLLRPVAGGNRRLLLDVPNRGRKLALGLLNSTPRVPDPTTAADFGNGFLMRQGYTVAWIGWQHDVPRQDGMMALDVPAARGASGLLRCEFRPNVRAEILPMADRYHIPHPVADPHDPEARLTARAHAGAAEVAVPRRSWQFSDPSHVRLEGGFEPGTIYDLIYRAADPPLVALDCWPSATPRPSCGGAAPATRAPARSTASTSSAFRRPDASCVTSSTSVSPRTRRAGRCSTRSFPTWPARGGASSICASGSPR